jgi:hypothetical protein
MYRNLAFMLTNFLGVNVTIRSIFLLLISFWSVYLTTIYFPFVSKLFNRLELISNVSAWIVLFCGNLYVNFLSQFWENFLFFNIILFNLLFMMKFLQAFIKMHLRKISRSFKLLIPILKTRLMKFMSYLSKLKKKNSIKKFRIKNRRSTKNKNEGKKLSVNFRNDNSTNFHDGI